MAVATDRDTGLKIRALRKAAGLTQAELAEGAGLEHESINRIENARLNPSRATLQRIAGALGTTLADLESRKPATAPSPHLSPARRRLLRLVHELTEEQVEVLVKALGSILRLVADVAPRAAKRPPAEATTSKRPRRP